jgi:hypothetical protein
MRPLYPQKLALISPTSSGRSVNIIRSRTKATELVLANAKVFLLKPIPLCRKEEHFD